jgi:phosphoribosylformylglycinamidine synthase
MLSESQERMLVIVQAGREREIEAVFEKWDLHAAHVGTVTDTGRMVVTQHGDVVADIPARALTDEAPVYQRESRRPAYLDETSKWTPEGAGLADLDPAQARAALPRLLSHPTIASKRWIYRQYDHIVQHGTVVLPGSDAGVVRLRLGAKEKFIAISNDCNGRYCYLNPRRGALIAVAECLRNLVCSGATPLAMTDNLNFGNPHKPENFYQLKECVAGLAEACRFFDVPVVGGNVSLYNESPEGAIDPTPTVSVVGFIEEEADITRQFARRAGSRLVLLGGAPNELGGSQFLGLIHGRKTGDAPAVDLPAEKRLQDFLLGQIRAGRVGAAHDLSEGGLLVALCEMLFGPDPLGAAVDLRGLAAPRLDALLFGESQGRVLVAVAPADEAALVAAARAAGVPADGLGTVTGAEALSVETSRGPLEWGVSELRLGWETCIEKAMKRPGLA